MLGKTNMDELAMGGSSQTSYFGGVKKPLRLNSCTGGSSGSAAASVSADLCAAALGSGYRRFCSSACFILLVLQVLNRHTALFQDGDLSHSHLHLTKSALSQKSAEDTGYMLEGIYGYDENDAFIKPKTQEGQL